MADVPRSPLPSDVPLSARTASFAAAVDLGSNSFHMVVGRIEAGQLNVVDKLRERVQLAAGLDAEGHLTEEAVARALACLQRFGQRIDGMASERVRVVGTNTLRKAKNGRAFMERARAALGYPVEIISGREEARLIYLGVAQTMPDVGRRLVVDIGGGSTEVIVGEGFETLAADSLYMGCVSFTQRFFSDGAITAQGFRDAQLAAELELQSIAHGYRKLGWGHALGCSGTINAVYAIARENGWLETDAITPRTLKKLRKSLIATGHATRLALPGLVDDRKDVIAAGTAILEAVFVNLRIERMVPSAGVLREGVLYDLVGRINREDVRDRTIGWFQLHYQVDVEQAERVEQSALTLLDQATRVWTLDEGWGEQLLAWASRLHEIGVSISHTGYHKHGAYLVTHAHMAGFSREEQQTVAALIANQRRKIKPEAFETLDPQRVTDVLRLVVLLRLAVRLNRGRDVDRPPFVLKVKKDQLRLHFPDGWLVQHPLTLAALEDEASYLQAFGFHLSLHEAAPSTP
ncbi:MAG: exopolyphosphatase [Myxococcota bacterium]